MICAIGKPKFFEDYVKFNSVVIDVGINRDEKTGKLCGDVDFEAVKDIVKFITPGAWWNNSAFWRVGMIII